MVSHSLISFKMKLTVNVAHNTCLLLFSFMTHSIFNFSEVKRPFLTANNVEMKSSVFILAISVVIFRFFCSVLFRSEFKVAGSRRTQNQFRHLREELVSNVHRHQASPQGQFPLAPHIRLF